jgi:hypothetical protein
MRPGNGVSPQMRDHLITNKLSPSSPSKGEQYDPRGGRVDVPGGFALPCR